MDDLIERGIKVDLIITDPPYEVSVTNWGGSINTIKKFKNSTKQVAEAWIDNWYNFDLFIEKARKLQDKLNIYFWCNKKQIPMYINYFSKEKKILFDILFWNKKNAIPSYNNKYLSDCEYLLYFKEKWAYNKPQNYEDAKTCHLWIINHADKKKYWHPTIKPLDFSEKVIRNSCPVNWIVFDPFMWSWTNWVAAINNWRNFIGIEIEKKWFNIAKQRNIWLI